MTTMYAAQGPNTPSITELLTNPPVIRDRAFEELIRIATGILRNRTSHTARQVNLHSELVYNVLLPAAGAMECLFDMGFVESVDFIFFPQHADVDKLARLRHELIGRRDESLLMTEERDVVADSEVAIHLPDPEVPLVELPPSAFQPLPPPPPNEHYANGTVRHLETLSRYAKNLFLARVLNNCNEVMQYEKRDVQREALRLIPIDELRKQALEARDIPENKMQSDQFLLVKELMIWFKHKFFKWLDAPPCDRCFETKTLWRGYLVPQTSGADRVEIYECPNCLASVRFVRFRDVSRLLVTRKGRCGEFASCFTLMCRALRWDARLVLDSSDHAWTEVWLSEKKKWVHVDPCECLIDVPLRYEHGWKKKLTYIMAYSCDEVQDVTWRYSSNHRAVMERRDLTDEQDLRDMICAVRDHIGGTLLEPRRRFVVERSARELVELMKQPQVSDDAAGGRLSGSMDFRAIRGELGQVGGRWWAVKCKELDESMTWTWGYSPVTDRYQNGEFGWEIGVLAAENIQRKVEEDWQQAYLCRIDAANGESVGVISWRFIIDEVALETIEITFPFALYWSAEIEIVVSSGDIHVPIDGTRTTFVLDQFKGKQVINVCAKLKGGRGENAWQHSQLFRKPLNDKTMSFQMKMTFDPEYFTF